MPYLLISTQIRMVSTRWPSLGVGVRPGSGVGGRCRPHLGASLPGDARGWPDPEAARNTPPWAAGREAGSWTQPGSRDSESSGGPATAAPRRGPG